MQNFIHTVKNGQYEEAGNILSENIETILRKKLFEMKKQVAAKMCEQMGLGPTEADKRKTGVIEALDPEEQKNVEVERGTPAPKNITVIHKNNLKEEQLDEARTKIVKARIRGGKIQRRKKVSNVEGYKVAGGQLKRMSPAERRNRKLGQRRGKIKRRSKLTRTLMKRQRSLRKRKSLGL